MINKVKEKKKKKIKKITRLDICHRPGRFHEITLDAGGRSWAQEGQAKGTRIPSNSAGKSDLIPAMSIPDIHIPKVLRPSGMELSSAKILGKFFNCFFFLSLLSRFTSFSFRFVSWRNVFLPWLPLNLSGNLSFGKMEGLCRLSPLLPLRPCCDIADVVLSFYLSLPFFLFLL